MTKAAEGRPLGGFCLLSLISYRKPLKSRKAVALSESQTGFLIHNLI